MWPRMSAWSTITFFQMYLSNASDTHHPTPQMSSADTPAWASAVAPSTHMDCPAISEEQYFLSWQRNQACQGRTIGMKPKLGVKREQAVPQINVFFYNWLWAWCTNDLGNVYVIQTRYPFCEQIAEICTHCQPIQVSCNGWLSENPTTGDCH